MTVAHASQSVSLPAWVVFTVVPLALISCEMRNAGGEHPTNEDGKLVVVIVDRSLSVAHDTTLYARALRTVVARIREGDRIVIAPITATSGTDFVGDIDHEVPPPLPKKGLMEEPVRYRRALAMHEDSVAAVHTRIERDIDALIAEQPSSGRSSILEALRVVAPLFHTERRRKILIILSDMLEDSRVADFQSAAPDERSTTLLIENARTTGTLPDLAGVSVYVAGVLSTPAAQAAAIERFWRTFFDAAGAMVEEGAYQRVLASFPE